MLSRCVEKASERRLKRLITCSKQHCNSYDIQDGWRQRVTVLNETVADGHRNYHTHFENITTNNTTVMPFILTLYKFRKSTK